MTICIYPQDLWPTPCVHPSVRADWSRATRRVPYRFQAGATGTARNATVRWAIRVMQGGWFIIAIGRWIGSYCCSSNDGLVAIKRWRKSSASCVVWACTTTSSPSLCPSWISRPDLSIPTTPPQVSIHTWGGDDRLTNRAFYSMMTSSFLHRDQSCYWVLSLNRWASHHTKRRIVCSDVLMFIPRTMSVYHAGNVSVFFPNIEIDEVTSACHTNPNETYGGFLVQFDTEFGNLPLLSSSTTLNITISEFRAGNSVSIIDCECLLHGPYTFIVLESVFSNLSGSMIIV